MDEKPALDSAATTPQIIETHHLKLWSKIAARDIQDLASNPTDEKMHRKSPFPYSPAINSKVALWFGDITQLSVTAIVNTTNEHFNERSVLNERILTKGGPQMRHFLAEKLRICKTGDAKLSKGYDLPTRYVIHTVGPKYNPKYHTAAENALYNCYSKVLQISRDNQFKSLAFCAINTANRGYPRQSAAHIALRVVRRFLEHYSESIELIVFAVEDIDIGFYELLMPFYFPRSEPEEEYALYYLPQDVGGDNGEPVIPEREIRIQKAKPNTITSVEESVDLSSGLDSSVAVGKTAFAKMQGDLDKYRGRSAITPKNYDPMTQEIQRQHRYERLLRKANVEDFSDYISARCLYISGEDVMGRPVVVIVGKRFRADTMSNERTLMYLIRLLDPIVTKEYIVIYFHSMTQKENIPSISFVQNVYNLLGYEYKKNLKAFYLIHPSFWCRLIVWWFTTFNATILKRKLFCIGGVEYLKNVVSLQKLQVPSFVMDYDFKVNGVRYSEVQSPQQQTNDSL
ncbi:protein GDAP2 homolog [Oppia nitens]|uniref:protein GDAP2 homolog n=1 Tax=Oppia nitens TaxID=1686743 RepID=UPI0023DAB5F5|nr:protein GDAP2 homolog [Oppia nitens]